jgi:hypothetical protein
MEPHAIGAYLCESLIMTTASDEKKPRRGRPPLKADGTPMSAAERQKRRRARLIDSEKALEAVLQMFIADEALRLALRARDPDPATDRAYRAQCDARVDLTFALGKAPMWPIRELQKRAWAKGQLYPAFMAEAVGAILTPPVSAPPSHKKVRRSRPKTDAT